MRFRKRSFTIAVVSAANAWRCVFNFRPTPTFHSIVHHWRKQPGWHHFRKITAPNCATFWVHWCFFNLSWILISPNAANFFNYEVAALSVVFRFHLWREDYLVSKHVDPNVDMIKKTVWKFLCVRFETPFIKIRKFVENITCHC